MAAILGMRDETTQRENIIFHQTILLLTWVIFVIFLILPVEVTLRSEISGAELGIWQGLYDLLHTVDTPWNAWPSLHIVQSLLALLVVSRWYNSESKNGISGFYGSHGLCSCCLLSQLSNILSGMFSVELSLP